MVFALNTGMRQSEILDLTWGRVDFFRRTLTILEQKDKGKDSLPLNVQAMEVLKTKNRVRSIKSNYVFFNGEGRRINTRNVLRAFYSAVNKAEIDKFRFHDLRPHSRHKARAVRGGPLQGPEAVEA